MRQTTTIDIGTIVRYGISIIGLLAIVSYVAFQARFLILGPQLVLEPEPATVYTDRLLAITGTTDNVSSITLNGRPISIDEHGFFNETLVLEDGYTIMTLRAEDRYGRDTVLTRSFVYQPAFGHNL